MQETKVWDPLVRIVHWSLALFILGAAVTAEQAPLLTLHILFGSGAVLLVLVRLLWGLFGTRHALFSNFVRGPQAVLVYGRQMLRRQAPRMLGHNPPAGWVMLSMLVLVAAIGAPGLAALGGEEQIGPLSAWFGFKAGHAAKELHEGLSGVLWAFVGLHLAGIALHTLLHRENIVRSMFTGRKLAPAGDVRPAGSSRKRWTWGLLASLTPALLLAPWLATLPTDHRSPTTQAALIGELSPPARMWRQECGPCHFAFAPELLPERSWRHVFATLGEHYGQDAWLPEKTRQTLEAYAIAHSAERVPTEAGFQLWRRTSADALPLRITASPYWKQRHAAIDPAVYRQAAVGNRTNCAACHRLALAGSFENSDIALPGAGALRTYTAAQGSRPHVADRF